jgi:uncharacterized membrane protein YhiD involved in acid resistance
MTQQPVTENASLAFRVLEKQGFAILFGVVMLFIVYRFSESHFKYLDSQTEAMGKQSGTMQVQTETLVEISKETHEQTRELKEIKDSNQRQEVSQREMTSTLIDENTKRKKEHDAVLEAIKAKP